MNDVRLLYLEFPLVTGVTDQLRQGDSKQLSLNLNSGDSVYKNMFFFFLYISTRYRLTFLWAQKQDNILFKMSLAEQK